MNEGRIELRDGEGNVCFYSEYIPEEKWIYSCWIGSISDDIVKKGGEINIQLIERFKCKYILNDNRQLTGNWSESNDWIESEFMPRVITLGLRYIAHIFSPKFITKFSAVDLSTRELPVIFNTFDNLTAAEEWLRKVRDSEKNSH